MFRQPESFLPTTRNTKKDRGEAGFTLTELLLVILLLGILSKVAIASFGGIFSSVKIEEAAREIQTALQYARIQAIVKDVPRGQGMGLWFSLSQEGQDDGNWFKMIQANGTDGASPLPQIHPIDKRMYAVDFDESGYFQGTTIKEIQLDANNQLFFDHEGTPSIGGNITIMLAEEQRTISVSMPHGRVSVY